MRILWVHHGEGWTPGWGNDPVLLPRGEGICDKLGHGRVWSAPECALREVGLGPFRIPWEQS